MDAFDDESPGLPLSCDIILGDLLEPHVEEFRAWVSALGTLVAQALMESQAIEACEELFDHRRWESGVGTDPTGRGKLRFRTVNRRSWKDVCTTGNLRGLGISVRPLPHVHERIGFDSTISLQSAWHDNLWNYASWTLPARFLPHNNGDWFTRLVDECTTFCDSAGGVACLLGRFRPLRFLERSLASVDYRAKLWLPTDVMFLTEQHLRCLGGVELVRDSGLFRRVDQVSDRPGGLYRLTTRADPLGKAEESDVAYAAELGAFLSPILLATDA